MRFTSGSSPAVTKDIANTRLLIGVLLSLFCHALVLSLQFGIPGLGLPGLEMPWNKRRLDLPPVDLQISLAPLSPQPESAVTTSSTLPASLAATKPEQIPGLQWMLAPVPSLLPAPASKPLQAVKKLKKNKTAEQISAFAPPVLPALVAAREPAETPVRLIAQDQKTEDGFVVPLASPEEPEHKASDSKIAKQKEQAILAEEKNEVLEAQVAQAKLAELALTREKDASLKQAMLEAEAQAVRDSQTQQLAIKTAQLAKQKAEVLKQQQETVAAEQLLQKKKAAKKQDEDARQLAQENAEKVEQKNAALAAQQQVQLEQQRLRLEQQDQQERRKHQEQLDKEHQLTLALDAKKALEEQEKQQAQLRQQQQLAAKQKEEFNALQKQEELKVRKQAEQKLAEQKLAEQKLAEQKLAEQKLAERKLAEQKLAEQKQAEQKLAEQKLAEQKLAEQKLAEQKLAEQKLAEQKLAEQKLAEQKLAEQKLAGQRERERALNAVAAVAIKGANQGSAISDVSGGQGTKGGAGNTQDIFSSELANRAREQLRGMDVLRGTPPLPHKMEENERARRRSIFGSIEREVPLRMYVDGWRQKVERNGNLNYSQTSKDKARGDPVVVVALRSDGSVEDVIITRSSGRADLDEAVKRIVRVHAPYAAFPPNIAAKYDVIEIRRVWNFDETLKILEEMP